MDQPPSTPPLAYKDRQGGLIAFGILEILIGCVCALFVPLMFLGQVMSANTTGVEPDFRMIVSGTAMYGVLAVAFVWLGVGSIMSRRWARALSLILGWLWLVTGVVAISFMAVLMPKILASQSPGGEPLPAGARFIVTVVALGFMGVFFVVLPGLLVLFYRSRHVKATCEARDPIARWTDTCPLPVLGMSLVLAMGALSMLPTLLAYHGVVPFFGRFLSGVPGSVLLVLMIVVWGYCARATYRLQAAGWWTTMVVFTAVMVSALLTFAQADVFEMYRLMGYPERQIEQIRQLNFLTGQDLLVIMSIGCLPSLGYLLWVRKYFRPPA